MSSFPDSDVRTSTGVPAAGGGTAPSDVLARVKAEGLRRRTRRHRRNGVLAVLGLAIVAVPAIALLPGDGGDEDVTVAAESDADARPTPTSARRPASTTVPPSTATTATTLPTVTTIVVDGDEVGLIPPTSVVRPPRTTVPPSTAPPTTAPVCRNSTDAACGEFRWDPEPAPNQPLTAAFVDSPGSAVVGEAVVFNVVWSDPDATLSYDSFSAEGVGLGRACAQQARFGPWTPPEPAGGSGELSYQHTFTAPGTYTVVVSVGTADCNNPYGNDTTAETVVTVE